MKARRGLGALAAVTATASLVVASAAPVLASQQDARPTSGYETIDGSGTGWSAVALDQWIKDEAPAGITVNYNPDGAVEGREDYMQGGLVDFAASDPPFLSKPDKLAGIGPEKPAWGYSYIPDAAGGTAFLYHLSVHGQLVRNLRLSGKTLMEIFTGEITNWDNAQITKEYGHQLPDLAITPVLHSEGAGDTYFLTSYFDTMFPSQWNAFCAKVHPGITPPCGPTEFYPQFGNAKMETGPVNVADYISSKDGNGAIGYDEFSYALSANYPVVSMLNADGQYVLPTAADVTTALTKAIINENSHSKNYLQQNLADVYTNTDPGSYPLSGYSYLIVPRSGTKLPPFFNKAAGKTLSAFISYALCPGQSQLAPLGYGPLPASLVDGGLAQASQIPGHGSVPAKCTV
jgi:ABC-type phosphate transport system substrate-binding protein